MSTDSIHDTDSPSQDEPHTNSANGWVEINGLEAHTMSRHMQLDETCLYLMGLRADRDAPPTPEGERIYEQIIAHWMQSHPNPPISRSAAGMSARDVLDTARKESSQVRHLLKRHLAQVEEGFDIEGWQWDALAALYLKIADLDDLLAAAQRDAQRTDAHGGGAE